MRALPLASVAILAALLSGCAGPAPPPEEPDPSPVEPVPDPGTWEAAQFTGDFVTTQVANPQGAVEQNDFGMPEGVALAWLNVTIAGRLPGEVSLHYRPPGCANVSCRVDVTTTGGRAAAMVEEPEPGTWSFVVFAADGAQAGSYTLDVAMLER